MGTTPSNLMLSAAACGDVNQLREAHQAENDINAVDKDGNTAAMLAALNGHSECLAYAVENAVDLNAVNKNGNTAAMLAAQNGHHDCLKYAVEHRADVTMANKSGNTAAMLAAQKGHRECLECIVDTLSKVDINATNKDSNTAAMLAAENGHHNCLKYAVEHGVDVHLVNNTGNTAAMLAAQNGHRDCLECTVEHGADINAVTTYGNTVAMLAAQNGHCDCLEYAVKHNVDINTKNKDGNTAAMLAAQNGHRDCLEYAVDNGADIKAVNKQHNSAVMLAAMKGCCDCLKYALENGADISAVNEEGNTVAKLVVQNNHRDCLEYLVNHGVDLSAVIPKGWVATAYAVAKQGRRAFEKLWRRADPQQIALTEEETDTTRMTDMHDQLCSHLTEGTLPPFLLLLVASVGEYMMRGGDGAGASARKRLMDALRLAEAETGVRVAMDEWEEKAGESMIGIKQSMELRDEAVRRELDGKDRWRWLEDELRRIQRVRKDARQVMKQFVVHRRGELLAINAKHAAESKVNDLQKQMKERGDVEEVELQAAHAAVSATKAELTKLERRTTKIIDIMEAVKGICPEVQCKLRTQNCGLIASTKEHGLEAEEALDPGAEEALLAALSVQVQHRPATHSPATDPRQAAVVERNPSLQAAGHAPVSDAAQWVSAASDHEFAVHQARVRAAVEEVQSGVGAMHTLEEACKARDMIVNVQMEACEAINAWARASGCDDDRGVAALQRTISRWKTWQAVRSTIQATERKVEEAEKAIEGMKRRHDTAHVAFVQASQRYRDHLLPVSEFKEVEARWDSIRTRMQAVSSTLRDTQERLREVQEDYPEVALKLTKPEVPENLQLLQATNMLKPHEFTADYMVLKTVTRGARPVRHVLYKPDNTEKALKAVPVGEVKAIQREVVIPCRLRHQNIMPVELAFIQDDILHVQTQWFPEGDLGQWLQDGCRSVREVAAMACGVLHGLLYLHSEGVIHGDIKPGNILISDDLEPRISDWGMCRRSRDGSLTLAASTRGYTEGYAAPEVITGSQTTRASDMFAMGKVLLRMLEVMAEVGEGDAHGSTLKQEMARLAKACCQDTAADRPAAAEVQRSPLYRQPSVQQAMRPDIVAQSLAPNAKHFSWEVQQDDGTWQPLDEQTARAVEVKYLQYLKAGARLVQQFRAEAGEDEGKGDDGGPTGYSSSQSFAALHDGSIISFRSPMTCQRGGVIARVRRQQTDVYPFPEGWIQSGSDCELLRLPRDSEEFQAVEAVLCSDVHAVGSDMEPVDSGSRTQGENDMSQAIVESVTRVQNKWLWERYSHHKRFLEQREGGGDANELWLWHGSYSTPPEVLCCGYDGVDFRRSGDGNFYGRGAYFAEQPRYSDVGYSYEEEPGNPPSGFKQMIFARVLCGRAKDMGTHIDTSIKVPPEGYDSIRGGPHHPVDYSEEYASHMRVVYDLACVYPAYIVRYTHCAESDAVAPGELATNYN